MTTPTAQERNAYERFWNHLLKYPFEFTDEFGYKTKKLKGALLSYCYCDGVEEVLRLFYDKYPELFDEINDESKIKFLSAAFYDDEFENSNFRDINDYLLEALMKMHKESLSSYVIK